MLRRLDKVQESFLRQLVLLEFNLAPLSMRRDIAMLGIIHRAALGDGPTQFREYFYRNASGLRVHDVLRRV